MIKKKADVHLDIHIKPNIYEENEYDLNIEFAVNFVLGNCIFNLLGDLSYL